MGTAKFHWEQKLSQASSALNIQIDELKLQNARSLAEQEELQNTIDRITSDRIKDKQLHRDEVARSRSENELLQKE